MTMATLLCVLLFALAVQPAQSGFPKLLIGPGTGMIPQVECKLTQNLEFLLGNMMLDMEVNSEDGNSMSAWSKWSITSEDVKMPPKVEMQAKGISGDLCTFCMHELFFVTSDTSGISMTMWAINMDPMQLRVFCRLHVLNETTWKQMKVETAKLDLPGLMCMQMYSMFIESFKIAHSTILHDLFLDSNIIK